MATLKVPHQVGDLGGYLKEQRESARLSLRQLASVAGVSNPYLSQIERGLRKPSAEVLQQIAKGLQISAEALFLRAGLLEASGGLEVEVALHSDAQLTARQKRVLLDIYATFRAENDRSIVESDAEPEIEPKIEPESELVNAVPLVVSAEELKSGSPDVDGAGDQGSTGTPQRSPRKRASKTIKPTKPAKPVRSRATGAATTSTTS